MPSFHSPWQLFVPRIQPKHRHWLNDTGSLTKKIKSCSTNFSVICVQQGHASLQQSEQKCIKLPLGRKVLQRQVLLLSNNKPVVFAHTITQINRAQQDWHFLKTLGNKALGAALFSDPLVYRVRFEYTKINARDFLYQSTMTALEKEGLPHSLPEYLWARRCIFKKKGKPLSNLMVSEVMLPAIYMLTPP